MPEIPLGTITYTYFPSWYIYNGSIVLRGGRGGGRGGSGGYRIMLTEDVPL